MAENQIQKLSIKHEAIMDFMLVNPGVPKGEVARHFGISQAWLSVIIYSDAFQAQLRAKQKELFDETVIATVKDKLTALAHTGIERLTEKVSSESASIRDVRESTELALASLGFGTGGNARSAAANSGTVNNVQINVDARSIQDARALIGAIPAGLLPGSSALIPAPAIRAEQGEAWEEGPGAEIREEGS